MKKNNYLETPEGSLNLWRHVMVMVIFFSPAVLLMLKQKLIIMNSTIMISGGIIAIIGMLIALPLNFKMMGKIIKTDALVKDGPYQYCRNPFYLGQVIAMIGAVLIIFCWQNVIALLFLLVLNHRTIKQEEKRLKARFGNKYQRYCLVTPRYLPRHPIAFLIAIYRLLKIKPH